MNKNNKIYNHKVNKKNKKKKNIISAITKMFTKILDKVLKNLYLIKLKKKIFNKNFPNLI